MMGNQTGQGKAMSPRVARTEVSEMGWKGTVRSISSAANQAQREAQRRQRDSERQQAQLARMAELERAAAEVEIYENYIATITNIHAIEVMEVDWAAMASAERPVAPTKSEANERAAQAELEGFKPKVLESKKRQAVRREELEQSVVSAAAQDQANYEEALAQHARDIEEWEASKKLAERVIARETAALADAAKEIEGMAGGEFLRQADIEIGPGLQPIATVGVQAIDEIVPTEQRSLLASGKLSVKQMPRGKHNELYQDYVCGCALLVANTILGMLPVESLILNATTEMLNTATGHIEETMILSMFVPRATMARMNLGMVDASDAMTNFNHNMKFLKTKGFQPVDAVAVPESN
jgi:hypothetical protein